MSAASVRRHRGAARLGVVGGALGVVAGLVQATAGSQIPTWTGDKQAPVSLGVLTAVLSLLAGLAAARQATSELSVGSRAAYGLGMVAVGLLCFSTVGRLWYVPGPLLVVASVLSIDSWAATRSVVATSWSRCLLGVLGGSELLMAASAPPLLMAVGAAGGGALIVAAWRESLSPVAFAGLVAAGTVPFAAMAWTAVVPVLLLAAAVVLAVRLRPAAPVRL